MWCQLCALLVLVLAGVLVEVQSSAENTVQARWAALPPDVQRRLKWSPEEPRASYSLECRVRSLSSRNVNITQYRLDGSSISITIVPKQMLSLGVEMNATLKINEVLSIGDADDSYSILGEDLAVYTITENSTYYAFHDRPEYSLDPIPEEYMLEEQFFRTYLEENGTPWHQYYNASAPPPGLAHISPRRGPPSMHMWNASRVGDTNVVFSEHGHWTCDGFASRCQNKETLPLTLTTVSISPRAFIIPNFLNDYECDRIVQLAIKGMNVSSTGSGRVSDYRTSLTAWLGRRVSPLIDSVHRRAADLLQVNEKELRRRSEMLQVVNYHFGEEYKSHFDWARRDGIGGNTRFATLLFYLTNQEDDYSGGETKFPNTGSGSLSVKPVKGTAALFYSLLPDGNGDVNSLHQSMPVKKGEKWLSNLWVWDPLYAA